MLWDQYFYNVAIEVAKNSKCLSRKIGAVLVKDKSIIGTGYNGPPRGIPDCTKRWESDSFLISCVSKRIYETDADLNFADFNKSICPRKSLGYKSGEGVELCVAGHAERNALINSARNGICTKDAKLYLTCEIPCTPCLIEIINSGIEEIVVTDDILYDKLSQYLFKFSNLKKRLYNKEVKYAK